ncbi:MAG: dipeptide epimerase, partial [Candidatus Latescibacterota bacterium]
PRYRLLGLDGISPPPTSFTIGISTPEEMRSQAEMARGRFGALKVKVGSGGEEDALSAVREVWDGPLRIDANGAWGPEEAISRIRALKRFGLEFVEQPVPPGDPEALSRVREAVGVPVFADESALTPEDICALAGKVDGIVVKLAKAGGIRPALRALAAAKACGLKAMLGCMVESSLGIAAAVHLSPLADYVDLDGHLLLAEDPFEGIVIRDGRLLPPDGPGLGVRWRGSCGGSSA